MSRVRTATWIRTGTDVRDCGNDIDRILTKANLDYTVDKSPIFLPNGYEIKDKVATVRKEDGVYIGVVSPTYEIYQNADAFRFISEIPNIDILKAGETHTGLVYMIGKLPDVKVLNDTFEPYVIFQTSHNGRYNVRATICPSDLCVRISSQMLLSIFPILLISDTLADFLLLLHRHRNSLQIQPSTWQGLQIRQKNLQC